MNKYFNFTTKARARELAINWQLDAVSMPGHSWQWCIEWRAKWERIGRRYGLLREFRENGLI